MHLAITRIADGLKLIIAKQPHMRKHELQLYKYAAMWFLIYQYKNILNSNGTSSLTHNSLHAKSLEDRYQLVILLYKQTIPHSTTYWYCFINPRLKVTSRSRARPWGAEWTAWLTVLLMRFLCHYVGDMSAQSFLIVHHLVMCQNFLMLRYPMLIADGAVTFISDASSRRLIT